MTQVKYNKFDKTKVSFSAVKVLPIGKVTRKLVYLNYEGRALVLETPMCKIPFNLNEDQETDNDGKDTGKVKYSFQLSFGDVKDDPKLAKFLKVFEELNSLVKEECKKNSLSWVKNKKITLNEIEFIYNDHIKRYTDKETGECTGKYPDTFKVKVPYYDSKFACYIFDNDRKPVEDIKSSLVKSATGKFLIQCTGVYFVSGKFGLSWKLVQAKIDVPPALDVCLFSDDEDIEDLNEDLLEDQSDEEDESNKNEDDNTDDLDNKVDSSESDNEDDSEEEEEPPPPQPTKKTKKK